MGMHSSTKISSKPSFFRLTCFCTSLLFFFFTSFSLALDSSSVPTVSYRDHCASILPESNPTVRVRYFSDYPNLGEGRSYVTGGNGIFGKKSSSEFSFGYGNSVRFRTTRNVYKTSIPGLYKIEGYLRFRFVDYVPVESNYGSYYPRNSSSSIRSLRFLLNGFWSVSSGKLCMVGSGSWSSGEGNIRSVGAVFKLNSGRKNSTIFTSLITGTLESVSQLKDPRYFEPIHIFAFPTLVNYSYTLFANELEGGCLGGTDIPKDQSLSLPEGGICSTFWNSNYFNLYYSKDCKAAENCSPLAGSTNYLPSFMSFSVIQCSEEAKKLRIMVQFSNSSYYESFDPNTTWIGEGSWDAKRNRLCIIACRIMKAPNSLENDHVGDCSMRLSLRYPSKWNIIESESVVGEIGTNETATQSEYFKLINFRGSSGIVGSSGPKYEYTQLDRARKSCPKRESVQREGYTYPDMHSSDSGFDMSIRNSEGKLGWGWASPISIGDEPINQNPVLKPIILDSEVEFASISEDDQEKSNHTGPLNISYKISLTPLTNTKLVNQTFSLNFSLSQRGREEITAEGVYDAERGYLCMAGCRKLPYYAQNSTVDCEVLVIFQFAPVNAKDGAFTRGSIQSTRKKTDPLFFERLNISAATFYTRDAQQSIWRMDLEVTMVLLSKTLACIFVALQLFHAKKNPEILPSISLLMLLILTSGHMIPLLLNFEALFLENGSRKNQDVLLGSGGWLETNEVIVRMVTMVAFLLQFRLLQLSWTAKSSDENKKHLWVAEKSAFLVSLLVYIVGGSTALFLNWKKISYGNTTGYSEFAGYQTISFWENLRSCAGLVLDGFLFPQILLNMFQNSRVFTLSFPFYWGTTSVRLLPHAYDLYRFHEYGKHYFDRSYIYANPSADFYSISWDVIIPCGAIFLAVIIWSQQRFGGRCIFPKRFRDAEQYEKVPTVSSE